MKNFIFLTLIYFFQTFFCSAQTVTKIFSHQEQSSIIISYNLETKSPCKISLYVSNNGGNKWDGPLKKVKGDVGDRISSGEHRIFWSVLDEYKELRGDNIKFQIRIESGDEIKTIKIGTQDWTSTNLDVSIYRNGDIIPEVQDKETWSKLTSGAWCYYENKTENGIKYGKLYNWNAVSDPRGIAPEGFHIPSDSEWTILTNYLGAEPGKQMKSKNDWLQGKTTNTSKFSSLPGGLRSDNGNFNYFGDVGYWWSCTNTNMSRAWYRSLHLFSSNVPRYNTLKSYGLSVRCLRD